MPTRKLEVLATAAGLIRAEAPGDTDQDDAGAARRIGALQRRAPFFAPLLLGVHRSG